MRRTLLLATLLVCVMAAVLVYLLGGTPEERSRPQQLSPQHALLDAVRGRPEDPDLGLLFDELNAQHFGGRLPDVKVLWSADLDTLDQGEYRLHGMTDGKTILLKEAFKEDQADARRTLCHEMVHVKLMADGQTSTAHDVAFQSELRRVFEEGCFEAIWASAADRASLQEWIAAERIRLDAVVAAAATARADIAREEARLEKVFADLNERIRAANAAGSGWPSADETSAAERQRADLNERVAAYNATVAENERAQSRFNEEIQRYNLMAAYPDGLAEDRAKGLSR